MVPIRDLNIGDSPGFGGLDSGPNLQHLQPWVSSCRSCTLSLCLQYQWIHRHDTANGESAKATALQMLSLLQMILFRLTWRSLENHRLFLNWRYITSTQMVGIFQLVMLVFKVADLSLYIFGNKPPQMVPKGSKILVKPGFGGLIQGQIYNPDVPCYFQSDRHLWQWNIHQLCIEAACQTQTPGQTHQCSRTHVWETQFLDVPLEVTGSKVIGLVGYNPNILHL